MIVQPTTSHLDIEAMLISYFIYYFVHKMQIEHLMRRSFDNFNNLSNLSKFNNLSYLHFSLCAPMSSAALIHLSFLLNFFLFSFVVCCVR